MRGTEEDLFIETITSFVQTTEKAVIALDARISNLEDVVAQMTKLQRKTLELIKAVAEVPLPPLPKEPS